MSIKIYPVAVGSLIETNAYFYVDEETHHGMLIDPGADAELLLSVIKEQEFHIEKILLTHGHFDHIGAVPQLQEALQIEVCMQENGTDYAENPKWNLSSLFADAITLSAVHYLQDSSVITMESAPSLRLRLIHTPGHTKDGCIYYDEAHHIAFVGDSIFKASYGRTDHYGGSKQTLMNSIKEKILALPDETILLSGHSEPTTVGEEKERPWYQ